jgi:hypothetical protein
LLMSVRTRQSMHDANGLKELVEGTVFTPPIGLNTFDFIIEQPLDHKLKFKKDIHNFRFVGDWKQPSKLAKSIDKRNIISISID